MQVPEMQAIPLRTGKDISQEFLIERRSSKIDSKVSNKNIKIINCIHQIENDDLVVETIIGFEAFFKIHG